MAFRILEEGLSFLESGAWLELQEFGVQGEKAMEGQPVLSDNPKAWSGFF